MASDERLNDQLYNAFNTRGFDIKDIKLFLDQKQEDLRALALFYASEMGHSYYDIVELVLEDLKSNRPHSVSDAMDIITLGSYGDKSAYFHYVTDLLDDPRDHVRYKAMFLLSNKTSESLNCLLEFYQDPKNDCKDHIVGLKAFLGTSDESISINDASVLVRSYAASLARYKFINKLMDKRSFEFFPGKDTVLNEFIMREIGQWGC
ncbi:MAG TPA: hypothetical protein PKB02_11235 [Anaerohalosphaeraceae bacterium]|nr:hypothetical protein [Anaerohalosphaeraceae bacterium]